MSVTPPGDESRIATPIAARAIEFARSGPALRRAALLLLLIGAVITINTQRVRLLHSDGPARFAAAGVLLILGWLFAREVGRGFSPAIFRRWGAARAGALEFLLRLTTAIVVVVVALTSAGIDGTTLVAGSALGVALLGLAAQQTVGNLTAGTVLLAARPFRAGDRVRLQGALLGGPLEGTVVAHGLLYTTLDHRGDRILIPNAQLVNATVMPFYEVGTVKVRVVLRPDVELAEVRRLFDEMSTEIREAPRMNLMEVTPEATVIEIRMAPTSAADARRLTDEVYAVLGAYVHPTSAQKGLALPAPQQVTARAN